MGITDLIKSLKAQYERAYARAGVEATIVPGGERPLFALIKDGDETTLRVQGPMDPFWGGCDVPALIAELDEANPKSLRVLIESPGGLVSYGLALFNDLARRQREGMALRTESAGIVASAAVLPFLAAPKENRTVTEGSLLMVHEVWGGFFFVGSASELETEAAKQVKAMSAMTSTYAGIVEKATGMSAKDVKSALADETWYSAKEAVDAGYAAQVAEASPKDDEDEGEQARQTAQARAALSQFMLTRKEAA